LRAPAIKQLLNSGALQLTLFDQRDMASIAKEPFSCPGLTFPRQPRGAAVATPRTGRGRLPVGLNPVRGWLIHLPSNRLSRRRHNIPIVAGNTLLLLAIAQVGVAWKHVPTCAPAAAITALSRPPAERVTLPHNLLLAHRRLLHLDLRR
jgi:hypothetical protein